MSVEPIEWKSAVWWRKRPLAERVEFVHFPKRIKDQGFAVLPVTDWELGDNILITGPAKTGKSVQAAATVLSLLGEHEVSARWVPADDYVEWIKDSFNNDGDLPEEYSTPYLIKNVKAVYDIIVLDGLGEERRTEFARHELGSLIRKRYDDMRTTIITTQLSPRDIVDTYGSRVSSAIESYEIEVTGGNRTRK